MRSLATVVLLAIAPAVGAAQAKPVTDRWRAEFPSEWNVEPRGLEAAFVRAAGQRDDLIRLAETGATDPADAAALATLVHAFAGARCDSRSEGRVRWVRCTPSDSGWAETQALVTHDDGLLALVTYRAHDEVTQAFVRSLVPRDPDWACGRTCLVGSPFGITLRAVGDRRLARAESPDRLVVMTSVVEVGKAPAERLELSFVMRRSSSTMPGEFVMKARLMGEPVGIIEREGIWTVGLGRPPWLAIYIHAPDEAARQRALRMLETAEPGPDWEAHEVVSAFTRPDKRHEPTSVLPTVMLVMSVFGALVVVAIGTRRRRRSGGGWGEASTSGRRRSA